MPARVPTIFALSTAPGRAGVAVVRLSGPAAGSVLDAMASPRPAPRMASLRTLRNPKTDDAIDKGLVLWLPAPASFTGEDMAELHVHGGHAVVKALLEALLQLSACRLAEPGEFARRAFENGKLDLAEAEGLADLIDAETEAQRRQALRQASGDMSARYERWREAIVAALALVEAAIDFSDEGDVAADVLAQAREKAEALLQDIRTALDDAHRGEIVRDGFRVVLAGPPNVGKSSLLNALAKRDAAIVSEEPGTTRDVIEVRLDLDGLAVIVADTAGLREDAGKVEQLGIARTLARVEDAHAVLWIVDARNPETILPAVVEAGFTVVRVLNKIDLLVRPVGWVEAERTRGRNPTSPEGGQSCGVSQESSTQPTALDPGLAPHSERGNDGICPTPLLALSAKTGEGLQDLTRRLAALARERTTGEEEPVVTQTRHRVQLETAAAAIASFLSGDPRDLELRAEDLRQAANALGRVTGRIDAEAVLDQVFQRFCIGK